MTGKRILVTGGCGFIGTALVSRLREEGLLVRVVDNMVRGRAENIPFSDVDVIEGDVRDAELVERLVAEADFVVHLAAQTYVISSIANPAEDLDINVRGTFNVLRACANSRVRRVVFSSSGAAAGEASERAGVPAPVSPYGASKLAGEAYCSAFRQTFDLPTVVLRFSNIYGPMSEHKTSIVAKFMQQIGRGEDLIIYGDGTQTRDFVFVADVVDAIVRSLSMDVVGRTLDVGSGTQTRILDLVDQISDVVGRRVDVVFEPRRPGEVFRSQHDVDRTRRLLSCEPSTTLRTGLACTYQYFQGRHASSSHRESRQ